MAISSFNLNWDQGTDNGFATNQRISNAFSSFGLSKVSGTASAVQRYANPSQYDSSSIPFSTTAASAVPYSSTPLHEVWQFADTLQSTAPIQFYFEYGGPDFGSFNDLGPGVYFRLQVGIGTYNGSNSTQLMTLAAKAGHGTLDAARGGTFLTGDSRSTTPLYHDDPYADGGVTAVNPPTNVPEQQCYMSGDTSRVCGAFGEGPDLFANLFFSIERTKDESGNNTADGVIVQVTCGGYSYIHSNCNPTSQQIINQVIPVSGTLDAPQSRFIAALNNVAGSLSNGGTVGFLPITAFNYVPYSFGLGAMLYYASDFPQHVPVPVTVYGASHTYMPLNQAGWMQYTNPSHPVCLAMRYE